jgi:hypothetical protein
MQELKPLPPRFVNDGPIFDNVVEGDACDVLKFPVPRHHEEDKARFIGTADCVMTKDPDTGWFNLGAYRSQVYDGKTGDLLYQDNFKDFQSFEGENTDPLAGMFENLLSLEDRILNVFTQKEVEAARILFTD